MVTLKHICKILNSEINQTIKKTDSLLEKPVTFESIPSKECLRYV